MTNFQRGPSRANKPFAGKFARDWKKSLKIVSLEKKSCKWRLRFWINVFRIAFWTWQICYRLKKINENSLIRHQNWKYDLIWGYLKKLEERFRKGQMDKEKKKSTLRAFASRAKNSLLPAWRDFKIKISRPLFTKLFEAKNHNSR